MFSCFNILYFHDMQELWYCGQLVLAAVLGSILGLQRERWGKPAGPRTYALVTAGSTLFTILSLHGFGPNDPAKIAANIVVGIGFLGAGLIFQRENHIDNLTTAAGLWMSAAVGVAVGADYYILAILATTLMLVLFMADDSRFRKKE